MDASLSPSASKRWFQEGTHSYRSCDCVGWKAMPPAVTPRLSTAASFVALIKTRSVPWGLFPAFFASSPSKSRIAFAES